MEASKEFYNKIIKKNVFFIVLLYWKQIRFCSIEVVYKYYLLKKMYSCFAAKAYHT